MALFKKKEKGIHFFCNVSVLRTTRDSSCFLSRFLSLYHVSTSSQRENVLRVSLPYKPKGCTRAGQNTSRVLVANAMLDSS
jgi:hypothetical protein